MKDLQTKKRKQMIREMSGRNEMPFGTAFLILIGTILLFIVIQLALERLDSWSLQTCEVYGDCAEVIKSINR